MIKQRSPQDVRRRQSVEMRLEAVFSEERQTAFRALLSQPMLSAWGASAEQFSLVRRHADWLRQWLTDNCGWGLHLDSEFARLQKTPSDVTDCTRGATNSTSATPFNRRKYVLLCLALATLERGDRQTTLGNLARELIALLSADATLARAGIVFDMESREQRGDLVHVVRYLLELRVLERMDGDEQSFLKDTSDVLYNVNRPILAMMLNLHRGPSAMDPDLSFSIRLGQLIRDQQPETDDARNRELRWMLTRRLLDDPIVYFEDLDSTELDYLNRQRSRLLRRVEEATGLIAEIRAEGIAMLDDRGDATDLEMPRDGTEGHFTLLVAGFLAARIRDGSSTWIGMGELHEWAVSLIHEHSRHWKKSVREPGAERDLVADALARLEGLRLIARDRDAVTPRPAIARYGIGEIQERQADNSREDIQKTLWGL